MPEPHGCRGLLHRPVPLVGMTVLLSAAAACNSQHAPVPVSGTVTLDGKPVEGATVTFHLVGDDKDGRPATGQTDKTGTFRLKTGKSRRTKAAGGVLTAKQAPHRPGTAPAPGLRAERCPPIVPQTASGNRRRAMRPI